MNKEERFTQFGIKWADDWNTMPTPYVEITVDDFLKQMWCSGYSPDSQLFDQIKLPDEKFIHNTYFYVFYYAVVAVMICGWQGEQPGHYFIKDYQAKKPDGEWTGYNLRFFRIGCTHPNKKETNLGHCDHRVDCPDCGWTTTYNSGD
jgi:ribosomal protein S27E